MVMIQGESLGQRAGTLPPLHDELSLIDDDELLLARLRAGDEGAFRVLVDRHRPWLVRLCTRLLGHDAHAAEDAAQESLLKLHAAARRDGRALRVRPWLAVVARNTCVDQQRRRRPELPGVLPERAAPGDDPFQLDAALSDAWSRLSGRHREVLYLREVLDFSYKEIGSVMGLTMPATETLVFRARAALRREYERSGGTSFGSGLLGFQLARLGLGRRRDAAMADSVANAAVNDPGFGNLTARLTQLLSTPLSACGEQALVKVLSIAAGVVVAAATVIPGLNPFGGGPAAAATGGGTAAPAISSVATDPAASLSGAMSGDASATPSRPSTLKAMLGNAVPAEWAPQRPRTGPNASTAAVPTGAGDDSSRITPLRDAASAARSADRPKLNRPVRDGSEPGPLRSILGDRPRPADRPQGPDHPLRSLLADPVPVLIDPLPLELLPVDPVLSEPAPAEPADPPVEETPEAPAPTEPAPAPDPGEHPIRDAAGSTRDALTPDDGNVAGHDPALLRRRDR